MPDETPTPPEPDETAAQPAADAPPETATEPQPAATTDTSTEPTATEKPLWQRYWPAGAIAAVIVATAIGIAATAGGDDRPRDHQGGPPPMSGPGHDRGGDGGRRGGHGGDDHRRAPSWEGQGGSQEQAPEGGPGFPAPGTGPS